MAEPHLALSGDEAADRLLSQDPLALLIAMVLDQQIPLERAFRAPLELSERIGGRLDAAQLAAMDPDALAEFFARPPALHRFPAAMAHRVQQLCQVVVATYHADASEIWLSARTASQLFDRVLALPGFGDNKARIFVALLAKRLGVRPTGWRRASAPFGQPESYQSVADIDGPEALAKVRSYKRSLKAAKPTRNP